MEENVFKSRVDLTALSESVKKIREEIAKVIVGQEQMVDLLVTAILADGHVLIEGVPGVAKTLTAKLVSKVISVKFSRIQFTPDLMPSDVLGTSVYNMKKSEFEFKAGPIFSNIVLIDEINRAPAKTQAALFEVMEERQVTVDGTTYPFEDPYLVVATQNPIEHEGTYRLPEAQLDRFLFKIVVKYPTLEQEIAIINGHHTRRGVKPTMEVNSVLSAGEIRSFRETVQHAGGIGTRSIARASCSSQISGPSSTIVEALSMTKLPRVRCGSPIGKIVAGSLPWTRGTSSGCSRSNRKPGQPICPCSASSRNICGISVRSTPFRLS